MQTNSTQENVRFDDKAVPYAYDANHSIDSTRLLQDTNDATLQDFFSRPIKVYEFEWETGTSVTTRFDPWTIYFNNNRVTNRITNYNLLRAKLHVKFVINGNAFQYGKLLASYSPLDSYDAFKNTRDNISEDAIAESQRPHLILDPTSSQGGSMCLPMLWHKNYINIPAADWEDLGEITIRSLNTLRHANGADDKAHVTVFAWAEDVSMSVLTSRDTDTLQPQSGEIEEANAKGFISKPAAVIAKMAAALSTVPAIAPFAIATEMAASTVGGIAKLFGYSRPNVTSAPVPYVPRWGGNMATTNTPDNCNKLTVDDKQELTVDTRICGVDCGDPLAISSIASRESYLTTFNWSLNNNAEDMLWNIRLSPVMWSERGSPTEYHFPACAIAALPFKYWTGTLKYRFQIVCSKFHKGRLKFVWDPEFFGTTGEYNVNYMEVVDIGDTTDVTIQISNGQEYSLLTHLNPGFDSGTEVYSGTPYTYKNAGNGVLGVFVVNSLTTPQSTVINDVEVNVFVSAGDDFEVFVPDDQYQKFVYKAQSGEANTPDPAGDSPDPMGPGYQNAPMLNRVFTGEAIMSLRQLLRRYMLHTAYDPSGDQTSQFRTSHIEHGMFPFLRGNVDGAIHERVAGATVAPYNFSNTLLLHLVGNCFAGWRGSMRYKIQNRVKSWAVAEVERCELDTGDDFYYDVVNVLPSRSPSEGASYSVLNTSGSGRYDPHHLNSGTKGLTRISSEMNSCLEYEIPFYDRNRFIPGRRENWTENIGTSGAVVNITHDAHEDEVFLHYMSVGEDFQVYFWLGCPPMYWEINPPDPPVTA